MSTNNEIIVSRENKNLPQRRAQNEKSSPVRIGIRSKEKLDALVKRVNRNKVGRKVKADDLIRFSLDLLNDEYLEEIRNKALSNKDRLEILFQRAAKERKGISRDEFLGLILTGKVSVK